MWTREQLKTPAKEKLKKYLLPAILICLVISVLGGGYAESSNRVTIGRDGNSDFESMFEWPSFSSIQDFEIEDIGENPVVSGFLGSVLQMVLRFNPLAVLFTIIGVLTLLIKLLISLFVVNPLLVGMRQFFMMAQKEEADPKDYQVFLFGFRENRYAPIFKTMLSRDILVFLWTLVFVIPGVIKRYEYRMVPYILAENPEIDSREALALSKDMMFGQKWDVFILDLSFLLWDALSRITFGIVGAAYVNPYKAMTDAELYAVLKLA